MRGESGMLTDCVTYPATLLSLILHSSTANTTRSSCNMPLATRLYTVCIGGPHTPHPLSHMRHTWMTSNTPHKNTCSLCNNSIRCIWREKKDAYCWIQKTGVHIHCTLYMYTWTAKASSFQVMRFLCVY